MSILGRRSITLPRLGDVRVVSLNLWRRYGAWTDRRLVLTQGLGRLRPDLVAFVEAVKSDDYDQTVDLLGLDYHVAYQAAREADGTGVSIASRWPLENVREVNLQVSARTADFPGTTLAAEILAPDPVGPLLFVCNNPSWQLDFEHERELQAIASARFVEELAGDRDRHVVLAGDFDADPDAASMRLWTGHQSLGGMSVCYRDAWETTHPGKPGHTFTPRNPLVANGETAWDLGRRIDYIMVRCGHHGPTLDVAGCELLFDQPIHGVWASDHFGVVADLAVRRADRGAS